MCLKTPVYDCGGGHLIGCIDKSAFAVPGNIAQGIFAYGNFGRNVLRGPRLSNTDLSLFKTFSITERLRFTFRAEAFNVWNHPSFSRSEREHRSGDVRQYHVHIRGRARHAVRRKLSF
jgi:hypothetical protein